MSGIFDQIINYSPPLIVSGTVNYKGTWNASTNNPTLNNPPATSTKGDYYVVSTAGTQFSISFAVGDWIISSGTAWEKVDLTDAVSSVFGRTGAVVGVSTDYSAVGLTNTAIGASSPSTGAFTTVSASTPIAVASGGTGVSTSTGTTNVVLSNSPTIVTPVIAQINDASANATLKLASIASAVNQVTIENAATGNAVHITATGGDASVGLHLAGKGASGYVNVQDSVDGTKRIMFNAAGGTTNTRTMLSSTQTVDRTISLPDATDTLVGKATTDTLTNKTLTSPTLTTPILGTPSSGTLSSCTGLPISTGVSGLGTGIATALAINTGSAGAPVLFNGALGTPTSGTVTNLTGTASININGTVGATTANTGAFTTLSASGNASFNTGSSGGIVSGTSTYSGYLSAVGGGSGATINITPNTVSGANGVDYNTSFVGGGNGPHNFKIGGTTYAVVSSTGLAVTGALSSTTGANFATSSGSVGIGTASPAYKLDITDNSTGVQQRLISSSTSGTSLALNNTATNGRIYRIGSNFVTGNGEFALYDDTAGAARITVSSTGNVGIGTASPTKTLDVNGTVQFRDAAGAGQAFWVANKGVGSTNSGAFGLGYNAVNYTPASLPTALLWDGDSGWFTINTSSRKYKRNIVSVTDEQLDKALLLKPSYYQRKEQEYFEYGFIAEEVNEIGLDEFVTRVEGEISGLAYDKMVTLAIGLAQRQAKENANLVAELQSVRQRLAALEQSN